MTSLKDVVHLQFSFPSSSSRKDVASSAILTLMLFTFLQISRFPEIFVSLIHFRLMFVMGILSIGCAVILPRGRWPMPWREHEAKLVLALFAYATFMVPMSVWPRQSYDFITDQFSKLIIFFLLIVYCTRSAADARRLIWAVVAGIGLLQFAMLAGYSGLRLGAEVSMIGEQRLWVTETYDPNDIAFMMVCSLPLAFFLCSTARGVGRLACAAVVLLSVVISIRTVSRGGFVAMIVVWGMLFLKSHARPLARWGSVALALLLFLTFASDDYWARISTIWSPQDAAATGDYDAGGIWAARWEVWKTAYGIMLANFPFGVGSGAYTTAEGLSHGGEGKWETAHNSFLEIGAELGLIGLALFLTLLYWGIKNCRVFLKEAVQRPDLHSLTWLAHALETSLYGYIISGFGLSHGYAPILYLLIGLSVVLRRLMLRAEMPNA